MDDPSGTIDTLLSLGPRGEAVTLEGMLWISSIDSDVPGVEVPELCEVPLLPQSITDLLKLRIL